MWVATRRGETACGSVDAGRIVADDDPMLEGAEDGLFVRIDPEGDSKVEEATAVPGSKRNTGRGK